MAEGTAESQDPPLVDVKITNPVTYFKKWWNKIIGNEGVEFRFHIKPLTAIIISVAVASVAFGVGRFVLPFSLPFFEPLPVESPRQTPETWKETAFIGTLQFSQTTGTVYLVTSSSAQAINLEVPEGLDLERLIGKRVLAAGQYNKSDRLLKIAEAKDMEVLPKTPVPIPTLAPTAAPSSTPTQEATSSATI